MATDSITLYNKQKKKMEDKLGRELTTDEKARLMANTVNSIFKSTKIPEAEISDLEIAGFKE